MKTNAEDLCPRTLFTLLNLILVMRSSELRGRKRIETRRIVQRFQVQTQYFLENHSILMCFSCQTSFGIILWFIRNIAAFECFLKTGKLP